MEYKYIEFEDEDETGLVMESYESIDESQYLLDDFGERIITEAEMRDEPVEESTVQENATPGTKPAEGFNESIGPNSTNGLQDELETEALPQDETMPEDVDQLKRPEMHEQDLVE